MSVYSNSESFDSDYYDLRFLSRSNLPPVETRLEIIEEPADEPVTLDEIKIWIRQDESIGTLEDTLISSLITSAREDAERFTRSAFISQKMKLTRDIPPGGFLDLFRPPLVSVESVTVYKQDNSPEIVDTSVYNTDLSSKKIPGRIWLNQGQTWPSDLRRLANFEVKYTVGYADASACPSGIKNAIKIMVAADYINREGNIKSVIRMNNSEMSFEEFIPQNALRLLKKYKVAKL